jgi:hypothetical protein
VCELDGPMPILYRSKRLVFTQPFYAAEPADAIAAWANLLATHTLSQA